MFWAKAHEKFAGVSIEDPDIQRYLEISSDFQQSGYGGVTGFIQDIGHRWVAKHTQPDKVLEIGFGAGRQALFYCGDKQDYFVSEYSGAHFGSRQWQEARGRGVQCDARKLPFRAAVFRTVISIYNLEHILELQRVLGEVHRVLAADGKFLIALPCEGGFAWNLGRELTTRRTFHKKYGIDYDKIIAFEHVRDFRGVFDEITRSGLFQVIQKRFFPMLVPSVDLNLVACIECRKS